MGLAVNSRSRRWRGHVVKLVDGTQILEANGRRFGLHCVGVTDGPIIFHHHGGPSSRLEAELFRNVAHENGIRIVGVDRPGIGLSDATGSRSFRAFADDVLALADQIGAHRFAVSGWSEGGPWALGCAHFISAERLAATVSIAGGSYGAFGANWAAPYQDSVDRLGGFLALHLTPAFSLMYDMLGWDAVSHREDYWKRLMDAVSPSDRAVCADPALKEQFLTMSAECFRHGAKGLVADALALYRQWDFDVRQTQARVMFWQGTDDQLIVPAINQRIAEAMPHAEWNLVPDVGHFVAVKNDRDIFGALARALKAPA